MANHLQTLEQYAAMFGIDSDKWNIEQWRAVAIELSQSIDSLEFPKIETRGRPKSAGSIASAQANYQALAWQAKERIEASLKDGVKLPIKRAVEQVMRESAVKNSFRSARVETKQDTAYTEVRKILRLWEAKTKADKK